MTHTRYAFIKANWHSDIVDRALDGFLEIIDAAEFASNILFIYFFKKFFSNFFYNSND